MRGMSRARHVVAMIVRRDVLHQAIDLIQAARQDGIELPKSIPQQAVNVNVTDEELRRTMHEKLWSPRAAEK